MILSTGVNREKGFTLVEIMLSVLILGIGLTTIANSYMSAVRGMNTTRYNIQAMLLAQEKFGELEVASVIQKGLSPSAAVNEVVKLPGRDYNYSLNITEITQPKYISKDFVQACFELNWQEQNSTKNVILSTYLPRYKEKAKNTSL